MLASSMKKPSLLPNSASETKTGLVVGGQRLREDRWLCGVEVAASDKAAAATCQLGIRNKNRLCVTRRHEC